ncbi:hypothetical protein [Pantoea sp. B65]|uniref:hypothetical protein n=1 Tax=Pantoea sp. B65 TaxID=2813359 RepID=UPI0039B51359
MMDSITNTGVLPQFYTDNDIAALTSSAVVNPPDPQRSHEAIITAIRSVALNHNQPALRTPLPAGLKDTDDLFAAISDRANAPGVQRKESEDKQPDFANSWMMAMMAVLDQVLLALRLQMAAESEWQGEKVKLSFKMAQRSAENMIQEGRAGFTAAIAGGVAGITIAGAAAAKSLKTTGQNMKQEAKLADSNQQLNAERLANKQQIVDNNKQTNALYKEQTTNGAQRNELNQQMQELRQDGLKLESDKAQIQQQLKLQRALDNDTYRLQQKHDAVKDKLSANNADFDKKQHELKVIDKADADRAGKLEQLKEENTKLDLRNDEISAEQQSNAHKQDQLRHLQTKTQAQVALMTQIGHTSSSLANAGGQSEAMKHRSAGHIDEKLSQISAKSADANIELGRRTVQIMELMLKTQQELQNAQLKTAATIIANTKI